MLSAHESRLRQIAIDEEVVSIRMCGRRLVVVADNFGVTHATTDDRIDKGVPPAVAKRWHDTLLVADDHCSPVHRYPPFVARTVYITTSTGRPQTTPVPMRTMFDTNIIAPVMFDIRGRRERRSSGRGRDCVQLNSET